MMPAQLQPGQAPSELALNRAGFTPLAFANAARTGSSSPVYVAGLLRRDPRMGAWSTVTTPSLGDTEPRTRELLPDPATPVTTVSTPSGMSTSTPRRLWAEAPRTCRAPAGVRTAGRAGAGAEVDDVVGDRDRLRLVLHDQDGVALLPQAQQQVVHPGDVVRV